MAVITSVGTPGRQAGELPKKRPNWLDKQANASLEGLGEYEWVLNTNLANALRVGNNRRATTVEQLVNWSRRPWKSYLEFPGDR